MKVAIVTCGLLDCMLPLVRHLARSVAVDLYISVYGTRFDESIGSFDIQALPLGLIDEATTHRTIGDTLADYTQTHGRVRIQLFKYPSLKVANRQNLSLHRQLARTLTDEKYDVVHLNGYRGSQMFLYAYLRRVAKVWTIHDPVLHSGEDKWQTRLGYSLYRFFGAHFILHNQEQLPVFRKKYGIPQSRCHYVPLGPYEIFTRFEQEPLPPTEPQTVLFYGRISPYKGVEYLVQAAQLARAQLPDLKVIIAGKLSYSLDTKIIEQDNTFEFLNGYISNHQLAHLMHRSVLVICPYTDATQSGVIMTAYAFHKPVLATRVGGIPEVVEEGKTGCLVPPRDAPALADALVAMLSDKARLTEMRRDIKQLSQSGPLAWDEIATRTLGVYTNSLTG
jgi:glycosyltransferase involved in cell wall biosynthesis